MSTIVAISDVHIKESNDDAEKLIINFFDHPDVQSADEIYLLGDIFDLVIGPHSQYFASYPNFFKKLGELLKAGKKIRYIEGNHDFHLKYLFKNYFKVFPEIPEKNFELKNEFISQSGGKSIHLSHGDDIEIENFGYKVFKFIVTSLPLRVYANYLMPYFLIKSVGEYASKKSRQRNNKRYSKVSDLEPVKIKFQKSFEIFYQKRSFDIYVAGHSHVKDLYASKNNFLYVNNGYAQFSKSFIKIENGHVTFIDF